ncbi:MAG: hypothetical protein ACREAY_10045, partial [Nitrososphaera sp.]|uniref:hypothetical protein n=1 Tax=Nitrososphaera sp. TaxID=1971748 RepID=UPI003D6EC948
MSSRRAKKSGLTSTYAFASGTILLMAALLLTSPSALAEKQTTTVHINGQVSTESGDTLTLQAHAKGSSPSSLSGKGLDSTFHGGSPPPGTCTFALTGSISDDGSIITLSGAVTQSSNAALVGTPVEIIADASTGEITFIFGPVAALG